MVLPDRITHWIENLPDPSETLGHNRITDTTEQTQRTPMRCDATVKDVYTRMPAQNAQTFLDTTARRRITLSGVSTLPLLSAHLQLVRAHNLARAVESSAGSVEVQRSGFGNLEWSPSPIEAYRLWRELKQCADAGPPAHADVSQKRRNAVLGY
jgi:hypothetical protein